MGKQRVDGFLGNDQEASEENQVEPCGLLCYIQRGQEDQEEEMTTEEYMEAAFETWSKDDSYIRNEPKLSAIDHAVKGLVTESAELTDALKKHLIYGKILDEVNLLEEAGDQLWYLALL